MWEEKKKVTLLYSNTNERSSSMTAHEASASLLTYAEFIINSDRQRCQGYP